MGATTVCWRPICHGLDGNFELVLAVLANAMHIEMVPDRKTDENDAGWIADVAAHGLVRARLVPPVPVEEPGGTEPATRNNSLSAHRHRACSVLTRLCRTHRTRPLKLELPERLGRVSDEDRRKNE